MASVRIPFTVLGLTMIAFLTTKTSTRPTSDRKDLPTPKELKFMQRFGYLEELKTDTEALYRKEAIVEAIKTLQKFGDLPQTGAMDSATRNLMEKPRCGVPDVPRKRNHTRSKRYVIASDGWRRRHLTYFLNNWTPKLGDRETIIKHMERAFRVWSEYSPLTFTESKDPYADIIIEFARGDHYDGYPFDGPGMTLAHAYFPYDFGHYGGDVHFDNDENWIIGPGDGVEFYTVAAHEIGHSLGLGHSPVPASVMFPYYKGYDPHFRLDYDDILGIYQLYVMRPLEDNHIHTSTAKTTDDGWVDDGGTDEYPVDGETGGGGTDKDETTTDQTKDDEVPRDTPDVIPTERPVTEEKIPTSTIPPSTPIPNICDGYYDTVAMIRGELFVFKGKYLWRYRQRGQLLPGYPIHFTEMFQFPEKVLTIDAAYENPEDGHVHFFTDSRMWIYDGDVFINDKPHTLEDLGIYSSNDHLNAAFVWGKNGKTYFFSDSFYWRYNSTAKMMDPGYPQKVDRWRRVPYPFDTAFRWKDGYTYFFKEKSYYRFNDHKIRVDDGYPRSAPHYWFGCPNEAEP